MASKAWLKKYYKKEKINTPRENTDKWHRGFFYIHVNQNNSRIQFESRNM